MLSFALIMIFLATLAAILALYSLVHESKVKKEEQVHQRIAKLTEELNLSPEDIPYILRDEKLSRIPLFNRFLQTINISRYLRRLLEQANVSMTVGELILVSLVLGVAGFLLGYRSGNPLLTAVVSLVPGVFPMLYILNRRKVRLQQFMEQFPDALDMMSSALRAGHSLGKALQLIASEAPDPVGMEFRKTFEEQNLGRPMNEALLNMTERINSVDLKLFVSAVIIQRESGGNLREILVKLNQTIRNRLKLIGQLRVYTTQGRASGLILGTLPIAIGLIIYIFNPDYIMLLFRETAGQFMVTAALVLQVIGFLIIRKIVHLNMY
jgi:tight adherence protein B